MSGSVRSEELTVLCAVCANPVGARADCPTCGDTSRSSGITLGVDELDEALLQQVGAALAAQSELARRTAAAHTETAAALVGESLVLRGRLRRQRALLRDAVARRGVPLPRVREALARVDQALQAAGSLGSAHSDWSLRTRLPRDPTCPAVARRLVEWHAREEVDDHRTDAAVLIVSELATNALIHGVGTILLLLSRRGDRLRIEVSDDGHPRAIGVAAQGKPGAGGRGLFLVDRLASRWGVIEGTAHVWAELALS
jgi:anti-sigma regulatory factor (Ser/Thr protein kinase)